MWGRMLSQDSPEVTQFFVRMAAAGNCCLMLDYDGTLAPFSVDRAQAVPYPGVRECLVPIADDDRTRLALVSGRSVVEVQKLLGLEAGIEYWGSHGAERIDRAGNYTAYQLNESQTGGLDKALAVVRGFAPADRIERKPFSLALHWRGLEAETAVSWGERVQPQLQAIAEGAALAVHQFNGGIEIRPADATKASAVEQIVAEMKGNFVAAYMGDDLTDEDAFRALPAGSLGILAGDAPRRSNAAVFLRRPDQILTFLRRWQTECG